MIFFTSDLHIGHKNIIKLCNRPFSSLEKMDDSLISNWNQVVTNGDTIYVVGDLMFRTQTDPNCILKRLKGKKHLIVGNHDNCWLNKVNVDTYFKSIERYAEISDGKRKLALCHYPMMIWGGTGKGSYLIHGHIHNNRGADYWPLLASMPHALNASVEINQYQPVTFEQLVLNNEVFKSTEMIAVD